ncbi:MAG: efflux transporter outer membrane subunit [Sinobacteraceae bacterium]|nr:efflux transporter outer membrane subunit [Nevskiaceae bacterium]
MRSNAFLLSAIGLLASCAAGPDFHSPAPPATEAYTPGEQPDVTTPPEGDGERQHLLKGGDVDFRWWRLFSSDVLDTLVEDALARSPNVLQAQALLREAQADFSAQVRGTMFPALDAQLGVTREKVDPAAFGIPNVPRTPPFTLYNAQVNVSYTFDLFGANRRLIEGAHARAEYQAYEAQATELTLAANVVSAAIRRVDLQTQIDHTDAMLQVQARQLAISEERYRVGGIALEVLQDQRGQLEQLRASLPLLRVQLQQIEHQLAVYTGNPPAERVLPSMTLRDLRLPAEVPLTLPSELVRKRPDIRASEALWHQASADLGLATANMFPQLTLAGMAGSERTHAREIVDGTNVWSIGARLMQPIFHAGELRAKRKSAVAAYEAAAQAYAQAVLSALQQVADSLRALEGDAIALQARTRAAEWSSSSLMIAQQRYAAGGISEFSLLDVQRQALQALLDQDRARAQRYLDTTALLHALAGK